MMACDEDDRHAVSGDGSNNPLIGSQPAGGFHPRRDASVPNAADVGFCTDMTAHQRRAITLCERVIARDTGNAVQLAADDVLRNQEIRIGTMRAWLVGWGESTDTPDTVMGWMGVNNGHGIPLTGMPGYATDEQLEALSDATGRARGRLWLELMRVHRVGGVCLAEAALERAQLESVRRLARLARRAQTAEIERYERLLSDIDC